MHSATATAGIPLCVGMSEHVVKVIDCEVEVACRGGLGYIYGCVLFEYEEVKPNASLG